MEVRPDQEFPLVQPRLPWMHEGLEVDAVLKAKPTNGAPPHTDVMKVLPLDGVPTVPPGLMAT